MSHLYVLKVYKWRHFSLEFDTIFDAIYCDILNN